MSMEEAMYRALFLAMFLLMLTIGGKCSYLRAILAHLVGHLPFSRYYEQKSRVVTTETRVTTRRIVLPPGFELTNPHAERGRLRSFARERIRAIVRFQMAR